MNALLQRHCAKFIYIVPDGLRELMSDISRELIRNQPENIYTFIADYLDALMITRENARIAARLVDNICEIAETVVEVLIRTGVTREEANIIAAMIQTVFRAYLGRQKFYEGHEESPGEFDEESEFVHDVMEQISIPPEKGDEIAKITQDAYRKFKVRQEREKRLLFGIVDWRIAAHSAIALYRQTGVTKYEANRAAALIQAAYKGYYTRRNIQRLLEKGVAESDVTASTEETTPSKEESSEGEPEEMFEYSDEYSVEYETLKLETSDEEEFMGEASPIQYTTQPRKVKQKGARASRISEGGGIKEKGHEVATAFPSKDRESVMAGEVTEELEMHEGESFIGDGYEAESLVTDITESEGKQPPPNTEDEEEPITEATESELPLDVPDRNVDVEGTPVTEEIAHQDDAGITPQGDEINAENDADAN